MFIDEIIIILFSDPEGGRMFIDEIIMILFSDPEGGHMFIDEIIIIHFSDPEGGRMFSVFSFQLSTPVPQNLLILQQLLLQPLITDILNRLIFIDSMNCCRCRALSQDHEYRLHPYRSKCYVR